ncbi:hypothetical protein EJ06DRAFT_546813 [Trichodelitschia bisporula]|uniref:Helicase ATP-binding domain-containing protein n=1 Tax=Trichodelitschia bisporula TaxID=703511 RepID=A0A6G1I5S1_9PEZI|nr:hypothetical protein EJ06DRAFT_546813 [Trichodelitschia bisporula]
MMSPLMRVAVSMARINAEAEDYIKKKRRSKLEWPTGGYDGEDYGPLDPEPKIMSNIRPDAQKVLFSATFPRIMESIARKALEDPLQIIVGGSSVMVPEITQIVEVRPENTKFVRLLELLGELYDTDEDPCTSRRLHRSITLRKTLWVSSLGLGLAPSDGDELVADWHKDSARSLKEYRTMKGTPPSATKGLRSMVRTVVSQRPVVNPIDAAESHQSRHSRTGHSSDGGEAPEEQPSDEQLSSEQPSNKKKSKFRTWLGKLKGLF